MELSKLEYLATVAMKPFVMGTGGYADDQARRMAFSVNEALFARPKFGIGGAHTAGDNILHATRVVNINEVSNLSGTIMASEFVNSWDIVSGKGTSTVVKSHRPLTPFRANIAGVGDIDKAPAAVADLTSYGTVNTKYEIRRTNAKDLWALNATTQTYDIFTRYDCNPKLRANSAGQASTKHEERQYRKAGRNLGNASAAGQSLPSLRPGAEASEAIP